MSVTIAPATAVDGVGFGVGLTVSSSFVGPLPTGTSWIVTFSHDSARTQLIWSEVFGTTTQAARLLIPGIRQLGAAFQPNWWALEGESVYCTVDLVAGSVLDSNQITAAWRAAAGLGYQAWSTFNTLSFSLNTSASLSQILAAVRGHYQNTP